MRAALTENLHLDMTLVSGYKRQQQSGRGGGRKRVERFCLPYDESRSYFLSKVGARFSVIVNASYDKWFSPGPGGLVFTTLTNWLETRY